MESASDALDRAHRTVGMSKPSCSLLGEIIVNPHLIKAPRQCINYVVRHELAYLKRHDHGPAFWKLIDVHAGVWRKAKKHLDELVETLLA